MIWSKFAGIIKIHALKGRNASKARWLSFLADCLCLLTDYFRRQDEELDELSASVQRIGGVGLTIHEELKGQVLLNYFSFLFLEILVFPSFSLPSFLMFYFGAFFAHVFVLAVELVRIFILYCLLFLMKVAIHIHTHTHKLLDTYFYRIHLNTLAVYIIFTSCIDSYAI